MDGSYEYVIARMVLAKGGWTHRHPTTGVDVDDLLQVAAGAVHQAMLSWDPAGAATLQTWCWQRADGAIRDELIRMRPGTRGQQQAGQAPVVVQESTLRGDHPDLDLAWVFGTVEDDYFPAEFQRVMDRAELELEGNERYVWQLWRRGVLLRELADQLGLTESRVTQIKAAASRKLAENSELRAWVGRRAEIRGLPEPEPSR